MLLTIAPLLAAAVPLVTAGVKGAAKAIQNRKGRKMDKGISKYVSSRFNKAAAGGSMLDDREKLGFQKVTNEAQQQGLAAQQRVLNETAMAAGSGSPLMAGQLTGAGQDIADASADANIKAAGAGEQFEAAVNEQRRNQAIAAAERERLFRTEDAARRDDNRDNTIEGISGGVQALMSVL